ncbi:DEAD-domain-containing protein [Saccharata proteae CBS 121410]|uniref:RNA helicase n=1 Tax=Saccharata proteae CBS 121410 TaxID=1314787 RepID=A0A9P4HXG6_9PEZI|nr:DEAD-domain-containing protein [Saccharata proteae CBS 121410]
MAKRTLKESTLGEETPDVDTTVQHKKSKKDKKDKKSKSATEPATETAQDQTEEEAKAAKKARKAAKRAAKEAQAGAESNGAATEVVNDAPEQVEGEDVKAQKKAEKAAKKAKKEKKSNGESAIPESASNGVSTQASATPAVSSSGYVEAADLTALPQSKIDTFLTSNFITVTDPLETAPKHRPIISFSHLPITEEHLLAPFASFKQPTPIQAAAWPSLFAGRDVIGVAETGSGKTLAFGVPCIQHITSLPKKERRGVKAVIVSPTRELAQQIFDQLVKLADPSGVKCVCVYGGVPKDEQRAALKTASIVVATPGRLNDLIDEGSADISSANYVVLDEADRMLDKGFEDAIRKIISSAQPMGKRQTLMFTATWPQSVRELAATFMTSPVKIAIGDNPTGELRANTRITQTVEVVEQRGKEFRLLQLLKEHQSGAKKNDRILVFCLYKKEATRIEGFIRSKGFKVAGIHGDLGQAQRTASLDAFKKGEVSLLVATDVAARGLDIPEVKVVINVTFPLTVEDYVHRIGRTGRAGKDGKAITLFTEIDKGLAGALINVLKAANQPVPEELMKFGTTVKKKGHDAYGAFYKDTGDNTKKATKITFD